MNNKKLNTLIDRLKIRSLSFNKKLLTFGIFLIVSTTFWLLNALNDKYNVILKYPVKYINLPENKVLVNKPPQTLYLKVRGFGFSILQYKLAPYINPININVQSYTLNKIYDENNYDFYLLSEKTGGIIKKQISSDIEIIQIKPDTIYFRFAKMKTKSFPVKLNSGLNFKEQFTLKNKIVYNPKRIQITGPAKIIDTMNYVYTEKILGKKLDKNFRQTVKIKKEEGLKYNNDIVGVFIPVEKYTESEMKIPVKTKNAPDSLNIVLFPEEITIKFKVGLSNYKKISPKDFIAYVNLDSIKPNNNLNIYIEKKPDKIFSLDFYPKNTEYLILE